MALPLTSMPWSLIDLMPMTALPLENFTGTRPPPAFSYSSFDCMYVVRQGPPA